MVHFSTQFFNKYWSWIYLCIAGFYFSEICNKLATGLKKIEPDDAVFLVLVVKKLTKQDRITLDENGFNKILHVGKPWKEEKIKDAIIAATAQWEVPLQPEILKRVSEKIRKLEEISNLKIRQICTDAFAKCLKRRVNQCARLDYEIGQANPCWISGIEITPTERDWDNALSEAADSF